MNILLQNVNIQYQITTALVCQPDALAYDQEKISY